VWQSGRREGCVVAHDVFLSYSTKDKPTADAVCATLERRGIRCWVAPRDILPGMDWGEAIIDAIEQSRVMILVFSRNANASPQIKREVERAVSKGLTVVPLRIEDVPMSKSLEYFVSTPHWLDALTPPLERHLVQLADTLRVLLERSRTAAGESDYGGAPPAMPPPMPGPVPVRMPGPALMQMPGTGSVPVQMPVASGGAIAGGGLSGVGVGAGRPPEMPLAVAPVAEARNGSAGATGVAEVEKPAEAGFHRGPELGWTSILI
jgi:TIR domain